MTKQEFREMTKEKLILLDGATGSNLQKLGMPSDVCTELWICEHPQLLMQLQDAYIKAGSNIVYAPTFSANRIKLKEFGLEDRLEEINRRLVKICKDNAAGRALVAGDITMTGVQLAPLGTLSFEELVTVYEEQLTVLADAGVDLIGMETMMSLAEVRAAVIAAQNVCPDLPFMATLSFGESGRTLYGTAADAAVVVLQEMGIDAVGLNCSAGPDKMLPVIRQMKKVSKIPLIAKPNAGLPKLDEQGCTVYDMDPETFQSYMKALKAAGADIIGGCCGTDPSYIDGLKNAVLKDDPISEEMSDLAEDPTCYLASDRQVFAFEPSQKLNWGSGIDLSKDSALLEEVQAECFDSVTDLAYDLSDEGADALYLCAGADGIDEEAVLSVLLEEVASCVSMPVVIGVSNLKVAEKIARTYTGILAVFCPDQSEKVENISFNALKRYGTKLVTIDKEIICC